MDAGVSAKVRRIILAVFTAATGIVRVRLPSGMNMMSEPFTIVRGVLQGDIFCPTAFIAGLDTIFRTHDGVVVGNGDSSVLMSKFEYADNAALIAGNTTMASARVTAIAEGSLEDGVMVLSVRKSKAMHVHRTRRVDATTEEDVAALSLAHKCESCGREFTKHRGLKIHMARWCDGGDTQQRSRRGSLLPPSHRRRGATAVLVRHNPQWHRHDRRGSAVIQSLIAVAPPKNVKIADLRGGTAETFNIFKTSAVSSRVGPPRHGTAMTAVAPYKDRSSTSITAVPPK